MGILNDILHSFNNFSIHNLIQVINNPVYWGIIFSLVIMEGLLSSDNALVLAVMVKHLPDKKRHKALFYGMFGAYAFRFIAIGLGTFLIKFWWIKLIGAMYLAWIVIDYFIKKNKDDNKVNSTIEKGFWATVLSVELMDIAFSFDSVLAALGISNNLWVLWIGAMLGILMMRSVAQIFIKLINKYPELETAAYLLIAFISIKMLLTIINIIMPDWIFIMIMAILFGKVIIFHNTKNV